MSQLHTHQVIDLDRNWTSIRTLFSGFMSVTAAVLTILAMFPLVSVLVMLLWRGITPLFDPMFFWQPIEGMGLWLPAGFFCQPPGGQGTAADPGGIGPNIIGSVIMVAMAWLVTLVVGVMVAIYLAELGKDTQLAKTVRFCTKILTGLPSIIAGVFIFAIMVLHWGFSAVAGASALALLMLPTIILTSEEAIKMVPLKMKQAAIGMGCTDAQAMWKVTLPAALPGILTGNMLAIARGMGETAPLLFTALATRYFFWQAESVTDAFTGTPTASLAELIYSFATSATADRQVQLAWGAALVLVVIVLILNIAGQIIGRRAVR